MARRWYAYLGSGNPILPENYFACTDPPACRNGFTVCAIYAPNLGDNPVITANLRSYIANGLTNGIPEPRLPLMSKKYVYMRSIV